MEATGLDVIGWLNKGNIYFASKDYNQAINCYERAISVNQNYAEAHYRKGNALRLLDQGLEAINCYNSSLKIKPNYPEVLNNKGSVLKVLGRFDEALECFKLAPDHPRALYNAGTVYDDLGQHQNAIDAFKKAFEKSYNKAFYSYVYSHINEGSIEFLNKAIQLLATNPKILTNNEVLYLKGLVNIEKNDYREAEYLADQMLKNISNDHMAYELKARMYCNKGDMNQAITFSNKVLAVDSNNIGAIFAKAQAMYQLGLKEEVVPLILQCKFIKIKASSSELIQKIALYTVEYLTEKGEVLFSLGNYQDAFDIFDKVENLYKNTNKKYCSKIVHRKFDTLLKLQDIESAVAYLEVQKELTEFDKLLLEGKLYDYESLWDAALERYQAAEFLQPQNYLPKYNIALILWSKGDREDALNKLNEASALPEVSQSSIAFEQLYSVQGKILLEMHRDEEAKTSFANANIYNPRFIVNTVAYVDSEDEQDTLSDLENEDGANGFSINDFANPPYHIGKICNKTGGFKKVDGILRLKREEEQKVDSSTNSIKYGEVPDEIVPKDNVGPRESFNLKINNYFQTLQNTSWLNYEQDCYNDTVLLSIGLNRPLSLSDRKNQNLPNANLVNLNTKLKYKICSFFWEHHWQNAEGQSVPYNDVKSYYKQFKRHDQPKAKQFREENESRSNPPYKYIREKLKDHPNTVDLIAEVTQEELHNKVYMVFFDYDTKDFNGVLSVYRGAAKSNPPPTVMTTGYQFSYDTTGIINTSAEVQRYARALYISSEVDRIVRYSTAEHFSKGVYYPEPNFCVLLENGNNKLRESFLGKNSESPNLLKNIICKRGPDVDFVFFQNYPIITDIPTRVLKKEGHKMVKFSDEFASGNFIKFEDTDIESFSNLVQSHFDSTAWAAKLRIHYPFHIGVNFNEYCTSLFDFFKPSTELLKSLRDKKDDEIRLSLEAAKCKLDNWDEIQTLRNNLHTCVTDKKIADKIFLAAYESGKRVLTFLSYAFEKTKDSFAMIDKLRSSIPDISERAINEVLQKASVFYKADTDDTNAYKVDDVALYDQVNIVFDIKTKIKGAFESYKSNKSKNPSGKNPANIRIKSTNNDEVITYCKSVLKLDENDIFDIDGDYIIELNDIAISLIGNPSFLHE